MSAESGVVLQGINNIYTVKAEDNRLLQCRIKGKMLRSEDQEYNPLAPGDRVELIVHSSDQAQITDRHERTSAFIRWNTKRELPQCIAANVDRVYLVASAADPSFRPKFVDRVLLTAGSIPVTILLTKTDLGIKQEVADAISLYRCLGYEVIGLNMHDRQSIVAFGQSLKGSLSMFFGQSGVGKSTLINLLIPQANQRTAEVSSRYDRGRHTTNYSKVIEAKDYSIIDTPGVRELEIVLQDPRLIASGFKEIARSGSSCRFAGCLHLNEQGCAVLEALEDGLIDENRYENYAQIVLNMLDRRKREHYLSR